MELEPQRRRNVQGTQRPTKSYSRSNAQKKIQEVEESLGAEDAELEAIEGTTSRDHRTQDFQESPLKIFINAEFLMLALAVVAAAIVYIFFR